MTNPPNKTRRIIKLTLWTLLALIIVAGAAITGISIYAASSLTSFERAPVQHNPSEYGLEYTDVSFTSRDGLTLQGWWLETDNANPVIVMVHGSEGNRAEPPERMLGIARDLVSNHFNVLMFDMRGHGESGGEHISAGLYEKNDILGAVDYIRQRGIESKIGVIGFSMGAATSLMTTPECEDISAVVADGSYTDIVSIIESEFSKRSPLPKFFIPIILFMTKHIYGVDFLAIKPVEAVREITVPVFIIHGGQDDTIPLQHAYQLYEACRNPESRLWIIEEAGHSEAYNTRPEEYINRLVSFFEAAFN